MKVYMIAFTVYLHAANLSCILLNYGIAYGRTRGILSSVYSSMCARTCYKLFSMMAYGPAAHWTSNQSVSDVSITRYFVRFSPSDAVVAVDDPADR